MLADAAGMASFSSSQPTVSQPFLLVGWGGCWDTLVLPLLHEACGLPALKVGVNGAWRTGQSCNTEITKQRGETVEQTVVVSQG